jgi:hypothetical protein
MKAEELMLGMISLKEMMITGYATLYTTQFQKQSQKEM